MESSILKSTKQVLGIAPADESFDLDVLTFVNSTFNTLLDLGLGPIGGFQIEDDTAEWSDFTEDPRQLGDVKAYMVLKVRRHFDPPKTAYLVTAMDDYIQEFEFRIKVRREDEEWVNPIPEPEVIE